MWDTETHMHAIFYPQLEVQSTCFKATSSTTHVGVRLLCINPRRRQK